MMNYGYEGMAGGGFHALGGLVFLVVLVDLILVGVWLWKNISK